MNKTLNMLGLARRAGKLSGGYDVCVESIKNGSAELILTAADISEKTLKNLLYEAERCKTAVRKLNVSMEELGKACGLKAGIVSINDEGFAKRIEELIETEGSGSGKVDLAYDD